MPDAINLVELVDSLKKYSILTVDDDGASLALFASTMKNFFKHVGVAQDGAIAIEKINTYPYDALITDNLMPNISGKELITKMRSGEAVTNEMYRNRIENMPIFFLTYSVKRDISDVLNFKNVYYLDRQHTSTKQILETLCTLQNLLESKQ